MAAQGSGLSVGDGCRTKYTYRNMNEILNDVGIIIHGTGPDSMGDNNQLQYVLWNWSNANQLPNGALESDEPAQIYSKWL